MNLTVERFPYEEPYHINLVLKAFNGKQAGELEIYTNSDDLKAFGKKLIEFPQSISHVVLWEIGSERPEDRFAFYMRFRAFVVDSFGHCALHLRFCNNFDLPAKAISEFCILAEAAAVNRLGQLLVEFSSLKHEFLYWSPTRASVYQNRKQAELDDEIRN